MSDNLSEDEVGVSKAQEGASSVDRKTINMAILTWIGTFFLVFILSFIIYLIKKDNAYINSQAKEALNWSVTVLLAYTVAFVLSAIPSLNLVLPSLIPSFVIAFITLIAHTIFCIMGAVAVSKGEAYRVPITLRMVKS